MKLSELGEDGFIDGLRQRTPRARPRVKLGIGDDAAAIEPLEGEKVLLSTDVLVEDVHFTRQTLPPRFVGRKSVAVNASDIAAMGGRPLGIVVSLCAPRDSEVDELFELFDGVLDRARELEMDLVGGNLSRSPGPLVVDVSILGMSVGGTLLTRSGARPGESIYVSGKIGAAAEGLELLKEGMALSAPGALLVPSHLREGPIPLAEMCLHAHMDPVPRVGLGRFLAERGAASSCMDLSDGLVRDLTRLCRASGVGARIEETALPIHPGTLAWERVRGRPPLERALSGGEDYELLFTSGREAALGEWRDAESVPLTRIGVVTEASEGVKLVLRDGVERVLDAAGWDHFRRAR